MKKHESLRREFESENKSSAIQTDRATGNRIYAMNYVHWLEDYIADKWTYKGGVSLISTERERQVDLEGFWPNEDLCYKDNELVRAAACYLCTPFLESWITAEGKNFISSGFWPFQETWWKPSPQDRIRELQKAGALIAAEIDRIIASTTPTP